MEKFDLEALMESVDYASAMVFNVVLSINIDAIGITEDEFKLMLDQAKSIYESEEGVEIKILCQRHEKDKNEFLFAFYKEV